MLIFRQPVVDHARHARNLLNFLPKRRFNLLLSAIFVHSFNQTEHLYKFKVLNFAILVQVDL